MGFDGWENMVLDAVGMGAYLSGVMMCAETVAAGSGLRSEGVATARGDGDCGGEVFSCRRIDRIGT